MADLGSFGAARAEAETSAELDTFSFLGETGFRVKDGPLGGAALAQFSEALISEDENLAGAQAMAAMLAIVRDALVAEDYPRWWKTYQEKRGTPDDLAELSAGLVKDLSGRPTVRPAASVSGSSSTGNDSSGQSLTPPSVPPSQQAEAQTFVPDGNGGFVPSPPA